MSPRLLASFGILLITVGPACDADDAKPQGTPASIKQTIKEAIEAQGKGDLPRAVALLESALKAAPDDRQVLFGLGALSLNGAEEEKDPAKKAALLRKGADAFRHLAATQPKLTSTEAAFLGRSRVGQIRADALEGQPEVALNGLRKAIAEGFDDFDSLEEEDDLAPVRKLPGYGPLVASGIKASVDRGLAEARTFPFAFALKDVAEKAVTSGDLKGKVAIVDLWGTWCPPCRKEIPHLVDLDRRYRDKGLAIVGINCNESGTRDEIKATIKAYAAEAKIGYPCLLDDDMTQEKVPGFQGYPTTLFLDRTGRVRLTLVGYTPVAKLEAIVATLLAEPAKP